MSSVLVFVRVRPFNDRELEEDNNRTPTARSLVMSPKHGKKQNPKCIVNMDKTSVTVLHPVSYKPDKAFAFDGALWSANTDKETNAPTLPFATQEHTYTTLCSSLVDNTFAGFNNCLFAYGQTGSGKTYTMMGARGVRDERGMTPRLCEDLFTRIELMKQKDPTFSFTVCASYIEVYNEKVHDLLAKGSAAGVYHSFVLF